MFLSDRLLASVKGYLQDKQMLLLTDNFEQVLDGAAHLTDLLSAAPHLKILATSLEQLHVYGEQVFPVSPLRFPDLTQAPPNAPDLVAAIARYPAVVLFVQRAVTARSDFKLSPENARAVAEICARLDGLPLAIELAAARIKDLSPRLLLERLSRRLNVLTKGERDRAPRHQSLRNTLDWSYSLLDEREKKMFCALGVLIGGWTLHSAEHITGEESHVALNLLSSLVDKSLVQRVTGEGDEPRFTMLEIIREYGLECLVTSGELEALERAHAQYFLEFAREAATFLQGPFQVQWFERIERELDNIRAALHWAITNSENELGIELAHNLGRYWTVHDQWLEGRTWLERLLSQSEANTSTRTRARGWYSAGLLAFWLADNQTARTYLEQALSLAEAVPDRYLVGQIVIAASSVHQTQGEFRTAQELVEQGTQLMQEYGTPYDVAWGQLTKSSLVLQQSDFAGARAGFQDALAEFRQKGDYWACGVACCYLAIIARFTGDGAEASLRKAEALSLLEQTGDHARIGLAHFFLGAPSDEPAERDAELAYFQGRLHQTSRQDKRLVAEAMLGVARAYHRRGEEHQAREYYAQSLALCLELGRESIAAECLEGFAGIAASLHQPMRAARLFGAVDATKRLIQGPVAEVWRGNYGTDLAQARAQLDEEKFNALWIEGRALSLEQASAYALSAED